MDRSVVSYLSARAYSIAALARLWLRDCRRCRADEPLVDRLDIAQRPDRSRVPPGASFSWSVAIIVTRTTRPRLTLFQLLPWCFAISALLLAPLVAWHEPDGTIGTIAQSWTALAYIGLIAGPFGTLCVILATAALPAVVSSVGFLRHPPSASSFRICCWASRSLSISSQDPG